MSMAHKRKVSKSLRKASRRMEEKGTKGSYGHHSEAEMKRDIARGGKRAKKAQFALNMKRMAGRRKRRNSRRSARR